MNQKHRLRIELKRVGHKHIDKLIDLGYSKARVYRMLGERFQNKNTHFGTTHDYVRLQEMVNYLGLMVRLREGHLARKQARRAYWKSLPWYRKIFHKGGVRYYYRYWRWKLSTLLYEDLTKT